MAIRLSGLTSGLDTDAIVQELVSAYSKKTEKYEKQQTKLEWKQDSWKSLNTKIYSLYTNVSNMRMSGSYNLRKVTVSDNTKATVTASSDAVTGTQMLNILRTAQAGYITGGKLASGTTSKTTLAELGYTGGKTNIEIRKNDGTTTDVKVTGETTINDFLNSLKEAGFNASFDENNGRIFVSAKESGKDNDFAIFGEDANGQAVLETLGLDVALVDANGKFTASASGYEEAYNRFYTKTPDADDDGVISVDDVKTYIYDLIEQHEAIQKEYNIANGTYLLTRGQNKELEAQLEKDKAELATLQEKYKDVENIDDRIVELVSNTTTAQKKVEDLQKDIDDLPEDEDKSELEAKLETAKAELSAYQTEASELRNLQNLPTTISETEDKIKANKQIMADEEAVMKEKQAAMDALDVDDFIEIKNKKEDTDLLLEQAIFQMADKAVMANEILTDTTGKYKSGGASKIDAQDAVIELNGVEFTSSTNNFSINGLNITAQAETDGPISITTNIDAQGIYDKIKDFLTEYNSVINEMTKLYNADSASDYEPLTDEEKEAMSEEQIEKWENKIKGSLLRRDGTLNSIMSVMINSMAQSYEVNGQKVSLSTFGISTLGYLNAAENENYAYHIDGDEDDESTSGKKDKLMAAIEEDPDQLMEFMQKLMNNLYENIDKKMKSTDLSSAYKVYNDKELDKEALRIEEMISKWEDKVSDKEEYYYDKFSQMEVALSKLQSSTSSISSLLGQ